MKSKLDYNTTNYDKLKTSQLKRLADYWLRQYLLKITNRKGNKILCPIKKRYYTEDKIQVAHYIDRSNNCTRYSLENCHLISSQSNMWDSKVSDQDYRSKHHREYSEWLGEKKVEKLLKESSKICIFTTQDYINIIEKFRDE